MRSLFKLKYLAAVVVCAVASTSVFAAEVSPFADNISVNLIKFPSQSLSVSYHNDNDVNIIGPQVISTDNGHFPVHISSDNLLQNGFPSMIIALPNIGGETCEFDFVDGPYTSLVYRTANPPVCGHLVVGQIISDGQYQYHIDVTYQQ